MICSLADYRKITHDSTNYDGDVLYALAEAQEHIERETKRFFEKGEYTETLILHRNGKVYPSGLPLESVSVPASASVTGASISKVQGSWIDPDFTINYSWYDDSFEGHSRVAVTYVGGYDPVPSDIKIATAQLAQVLLQVDLLVNVPAGATSVSVGDVSYSGSGGFTQEFPAHIVSVITKWKRLEV